MSNFKVGEICVGQGFDCECCCQYNGLECEILGGLEYRDLLTADGRFVRDRCYLVIWNGREREEAVAPPYLRRRQPPATNTGELRILELFNIQPELVPA